MTAVVHHLRKSIRDQQNRPLSATVCGRQRSDGRWEGWLEFVNADSGTRLRTDTETVQSSRNNLIYWATGLEPAYLEGAFERARARTSVAQDVLPSARHSSREASGGRLTKDQRMSQLSWISVRWLARGRRASLGWRRRLPRGTNPAASRVACS